ncbi:hypothetical protein P5P86_20000 [Nocardioides sp. BP30]|uniref:hypothetical protein n=1 Tax=Nocardioides sp. BP30 TaxID=3036374 RepID=UPI0024699C50|nr:hypothetical protein [Nocardioides sp. BP30]WGL52221.1 hypothetical protein P5P86_20000 [Nocardioides sp. BP30]
MHGQRFVSCGALAVVLGAGLVAVPHAEALPVSVPATVVSSGCSGALGYREGIGSGKVSNLYPGYKAHGAGGTVTYCTWKFRIKNADKTADYYLTEVREAFAKTQSADAGFAGNDGSWAVRVTSSLAAKTNVYNATPTYKKTVVKGCPSVSAGYSFYGFSISLGQTLCATTTVTRADLTRSGAAWRSAHASEMKVADLTFSQKVKDGKVPKFTFNATRPAYAYTWTPVKQTTHGYSYTGYKPTVKRTLLAYTASR